MESVIFNIVVAASAVFFTLYLLKKGVNVGYVMLMDALVIALLTRMSPDRVLFYAWKGLSSDKTVKLVILLLFIMTIENIMRTTGMIRRMVDNLKELVGSNRLAAAFLPAVIGLMPSPGGARFSCPMVEEVVGDSTGPENKAFINYWFRHIWLDGFILYPGMILAAELMNVSVLSFFIRLLPFIGFSILLGALFGLSSVKREVIVRTRSRRESLLGFIRSLLPVIIVISVYMALLPYTPYSLEIASGSMAIALFAVKKYGRKQIVSTLKEAFPVKLVIIIIGVMVFKEILFGSGTMEELPALMEAWRIPPKVLFLLFPFWVAFHPA